MILPTFEYETRYWNKGAKIVVGIDEAGRGPLAGPVVAGAVIVYPHLVRIVQETPEYKLIRDSKTLSAKQRDIAFELISNNFLYGVGGSSHETIDRVNIMQASYLAMKKAVTDLKRKISEELEILLLDGRSLIPNVTLRQENIINGDKMVFSISAASIVAKVTRDRIMLALHEKFPEYGFAKHKGYGTKLHFEMIEKFGPCEVHRKSFAKSKIKYQNAK